MLNKTQQNQLKSMFESTRAGFSTSQVGDILRDVGPALRRLQAVNSPIIDELRDLVTRVCETLFKWHLGQLELEEEQIKAATAGVHYFINPWDMIEDDKGSEGYEDDLYVMHLLVERFGQDLGVELAKQTK